MTETLSTPAANWGDFDDDIEWDTSPTPTSFDTLRESTPDSTPEMSFDDLRTIAFVNDQPNTMSTPANESSADTFTPQYLIPPKPPREIDPSSAETNPPEVISLAEAMSVLSDARYELLGHGTSSDHISQILEEGIKVGGNGRDTDTDSNFFALSHDLDPLQDTLDHWQHKDSKHIVLFRPPVKYKLASPNSHSKATYGVFYHDSSEPGVGYYEPEYIYGWYDANSGNITKNSNYHGNLDNPTDAAYLEEVYQNTKSSYLEGIPEADRADYEAANEIYHQYTP